MIVDPQRDLVKNLNNHAAYWHEQFRGQLPVLALPLDYPRPPVQSYLHDSESVSISGALLADLNDLAEREDVTLFTLLLAAFATMLGRSSGDEDLIVGTVASVEDADGSDNARGNPVALRMDLEGNPAIRALLADVAQTIKSTAAHRSYPFAELLSELDGPAPLDRAQLFQTMLILEGTPFELAPRPLGQPLLADVAQYTSSCDLVFTARPSKDGLSIVCDYDSDLFDQETIVRYLDQYQTLLGGLIEDVSRPLADLPLGSDAEQILSQKSSIQGKAEVDNHLRTSAPDHNERHETLYQWFESQAEQTPDAVAVTCEESQLTYQALNEQANQLAHHLRSLGVGPEVLVGLCMERSVEMLVGILGILKAGGAYVPLELAYPKERLAYILNDANAPILVTQEGLLSRLPDFSGHVLCMDRDRELLTQQPADSPASSTTAANLAYVIYTSGSTGHPKGVLISHANVIRLFTETERWYHFTSSDVWTLFHSYAFDFSVWEIWGALLYGGRLVVVPTITSREPVAFYQLLIDEQVTILNQTPSAFRQLIAAEEAEFRGSEVATGQADTLQSDSSAHLSLRTIIFGGEALELQSLRPWFERHGDEEPLLVNMYGITETTVHVTYRPIKMADLDATAGSVIGGPILDLQLFVLGQNLQFMPFRAPGELHVGGSGLARGYLNRPDLTAERFVPHPYSEEPGERLYTSGDLARLLPNGDIEYAGRRDHQVKIRGFRIELGEIEAILSQHSAIREAVVLAREDIENDQRLVAYIVGDALPTASSLRDFMGEKLPDYMLPTAFVELDSIPLTANGKVDRKALPAPDAVRPELANELVAPRTSTETLLVTIWTEVLGVNEVGIHDNFFELGGHSLLATQVVSRLAKEAQIELPLRHIFEAPTLAGLAERIDAESAADEETKASTPAVVAPPLERVDRAGNIPLSFGQQRLWFVDQLSPGNSAYNFHTAMRLSGVLNKDAAEQALTEIIQRHEVLRTTFTVVDGRPIQEIHEAWQASLPVTDLRATQDQGAQVSRLIHTEARRPFELDRGPLLRFRLLQLAENEHVAIVVMHHIIADGWSLGIFVREFAALYQAFAKGEASPLPELPIQYADYAHWQQRWMQDDVYQSHVGYWKRTLADLPTLALPTDKERPAAQTFRGAHETHQLSAELSKAIHALSQQEGATTFMVLLAAFQTLLGRYANQDDVVVGADIANRNRSETENLIGFFANQLVLRTSLSGNPTFRELIARVKEQSLGAYAHQDMPFDKLVEELKPERDPSRNPLFQVMFILQNAPPATLALPGLQLESLPIEQETTAFDITLSITESDAGTTLACRYYSDLFEPSTIQRMLHNYETLLTNIIAQPGTRIDRLAIQTEAEAQEATMQAVAEKSKRKKDKFAGLTKKSKPKPKNLAEAPLVKTGFIQPDQAIPFVIEPNVTGVDLLAWAQSNGDYVESEIQRHGAILFRNFKIASIEMFETFTRVLSPDLMDYSERSSPRSKVSGNIFTSTDHPADQPIVLHNEQSYTLNWMMKLWFYADTVAETGGGTPIADSRKIYQRLDPAVRDKFADKGIMYVRNYGVGMGLPWQETFQTDSPEEVDAYCRNAQIETEWLDNGRLRTRQVRPAIHQHPKTGESIWFNHGLFFHVTSLEPATRESLLAGLAEEDLPTNTYYGDGTPFEPEVLEQVRTAFDKETVNFPWQQGDILMVDNMLVAHGRQPYTGSRKVVVAMAEPFQSLNR